jgi:hypothetical protein
MDEDYPEQNYSENLDEGIRLIKACNGYIALENDEQYHITRTALVEKFKAKYYPMLYKNAHIELETVDKNFTELRKVKFDNAISLKNY